MAQSRHTRSTRFALMLACAAVALAATIAPAAEKVPWGVYRGPAHNGISGETGWFDASAGVKTVWTKRIGIGFGSITVANGRVYSMGQLTKGKDTVSCFNAKTGEKEWAFSYACPLQAKLHEGGPHSTPTVDGDRVYTVSQQGHVFCLDAAKGTKIWGVKLQSKMPTWGFSGSALVVGDNIILNAHSAGIALNKTTGKVVWKSEPGPGGYATPVPYTSGGKTNVVLFASKRVLAVNAADGKMLWEHPWKNKYDVNAGDPIVMGAGERVFISCGYGKGCTLLDTSGTSPKELWTNLNMCNKHTCSILYKGAIYGFNETALTCLDVKSGKKNWVKGGFGRGSLALADGKLIVLSDSGKLIIAEATAAEFKELASGSILRGKCWSAPVLAGGKIYARSAAGSLVCVSVGK